MTYEYRLTALGKAQGKTGGSILLSKRSFYRLLQGNVSSGKTTLGETAGKTGGHRQDTWANPI
jgi:RecG-like helicase